MMYGGHFMDPVLFGIGLMALFGVGVALYYTWSDKRRKEHKK